MSDEQKTEDKKWEPKIGARVTNPQNERKGKVIGSNPPGMSTQGSGWSILVKWDNTALQDSWHDAGDLEWAVE